MRHQSSWQTHHTPHSLLVYFFLKRGAMLYVQEIDNNVTELLQLQLFCKRAAP